MHFLLKESFTNFDLLAEQARAWQLDFTQLDCGEPLFKVLQVGSVCGQIGRGQFSRKLLQRGQTPAGMRTFAIPLAADLTFDWRSHHVTDSDLLIFPESGELFSVTPPGFDIIVYSIPTPHLEALADSMEIRDLPSLLNKEVERLDQNSMNMLRTQALACTRVFEARQQDLPQNTRCEEMCADLGRAILDALARCHGQLPPPPPARATSRATSRAMELIRDCGTDKLSIPKLCTHAGVSERTLQYAFKRQLGMGPKAFLQTWRLNQVRRALSHPSRSSAAISDAANLYGFWHMGQFAADYRRLFGELPSHTRKSMRHARGTRA